MTDCDAVIISGWETDNPKDRPDRNGIFLSANGAERFWGAGPYGGA